MEDTSPDIRRSLRSINSFVLVVITLVIIHYVLVLRLNAPAHYALFAYAIPSFAYGYDLRFRVGIDPFWVALLALMVGIVGTVAMSVVVTVMFDQPIFPDQAQILDFIETCTVIALAYWIGYSVATYLITAIFRAPGMT